MKIITLFIFVLFYAIRALKVKRFVGEEEKDVNSRTRPNEINVNIEDSREVNREFDYKEIDQRMREMYDKYSLEREELIERIRGQNKKIKEILRMNDMTNIEIMNELNRKNVN